MNDMIQIQPLAHRRRDFARWAVAQTPKVRTTSTHHFAVPPHLFVGMPEDLLVGSLVDGHRYVSPVEDAAAGTSAPGPGGARLLDCGLCYEEDGQEVHPHPECTAPTEALVGDHGPEAYMPLASEAAADAAAMVAATPVKTIAAAMDAALLATDLAASNAVAGGAHALKGSELPAPDLTEPQTEVPEGVFPCDGCPREFTTRRGRDLHRVAKHPEAPDAG